LFKAPSLNNIQPIKDIKKNCIYLMKNFQNHPCYETMILLSHNNLLMREIADCEKFTGNEETKNENPEEEIEESNE